VEVTPVGFEELARAQPGENSDTIRQRVILARKRQAERYRTHADVYCNAQMSSRLLREVCRIDETSVRLLKNAMDRLSLSARAYDRILKVSRTIADLDASEEIQAEHLAEAIHFRSLDREHWGG